MRCNILFAIALLLLSCSATFARNAKTYQYSQSIPPGSAKPAAKSYDGQSSRQGDNRAARPSTTSVTFGQEREPPERVQKVLDERREGRRLEDVNVNLAMDCGNTTGYACQLYMQEFLYTYVYVNKSYDRLILPVRNDTEKPIDVTIVVTFVDLVSVDTVAGTMTVSLFIDYIWTDAFMSWDSSLTDNDGFIVVPNDMLWIPDIIIFNSIGGFRSQIDAEAVFLSSAGEVWWSGRGVMTFACTFDVVSFPFDSHTCTAEFSSWIYSINNINISQVSVDVLDGFNNLAWQVDSVVGRREEKLLWGGAYLYTFGMFDVQITRYYEYYVNSAIFPAIIITVIVLSSLFMGDDYGSRLGLAVTGLLTIIAIQWSVAGELPVAQKSSWLSNFLNVSVVYIAATTLEAYVSAVMAGRKHGKNVPKVIEYLIDISLFWEFYGPLKDAVTGNKGPSGASAEWAGDGPEAGVELKDNVANPLSATGNQSEGGNVIFHSSGVDADEACKRRQPRKKSIFQSVRRSIFGEEGPPPPKDPPEVRYTWERGSRALDRIARAVLPLSYAVLVAVWLGEKL